MPYYSWNVQKSNYKGDFFQNFATMNTTQIWLLDGWHHLRQRWRGGLTNCVLDLALNINMDCGGGEVGFIFPLNPMQGQIQIGVNTKTQVWLVSSSIKKQGLFMIKIGRGQSALILAEVF